MKNNKLEIGKSFAILSVVIAHYISKDLSLYSSLLQRMGTFGVPFFLFLSGYFYNIEKYGFRTFFKNKFDTIVIPWVFTGSLVYFAVQKHFIFIEWAKWILGIGTYLYYLVVLMLLFLLFSLSFIRSNKYILFLFVLINGISLIITYQNQYSIYSYINILNWIGFFSMGLLMKKTTIKPIGIKYVSCVILSFLCALIFYFSVYIENNYSGYFSEFSYFLEILGIVIILLLSSIKIFDNQIILRISKYSFSIYLLHFLFFPIKKIFPHILIFEILGPIIIVCLITLFLYLSDQYLSRLNFAHTLFKKILGIR